MPVWLDTVKESVVSRPNFIKTLSKFVGIDLYLYKEENEKSERIHKYANDATNTTTLRYLKEIDLVTMGQKIKRNKSKKKESDEVTYK